MTTCSVGLRETTASPAFAHWISRIAHAEVSYRGFAMFGLGGWEIAVLGLAALVFFGPHKLPQLMKQAGKIMREVRKASYEFQNSLERELEDDPYRKAHRREKKLKEKAAELGVTPEELKADAPPASVPAAEITDGLSSGIREASGNGSAAPPADPVATFAPDPGEKPEPPKTGTA